MATKMLSLLQNGFSSEFNSSTFMAVTATVALGTAAVVASSTSKKKEKGCVSGPSIVPHWDFIRLLMTPSLHIPDFVTDRIRAYQSTSFLVDWRLIGLPKTTIFVTDPDEQAKIMSMERKLGFSVFLTETIRQIHGQGSMQHFSGEWHMFLRKVFGGLLSPRALESFVPHLISHFTVLWSSLEERCNNGRQTVVLETAIRNAQLRVMCRILFGLSFEDENDEEWQKLSNDFTLEEAALNALPSSETYKKGLAAANRNRKYLGEMLDKALDDRKREGCEAAVESKKLETVGSVVNTVVDALIEQNLVEDEESVARTKDNLLLLLEASHGTTMYTTTALMYLLNHPDNKNAMDRVKEEVHAIGPNPNLSGIKNEMPFLDACIKESLRLAPFAGAVAYMAEEKDKTFDVLGEAISTPAAFFMSFSHHYRDEKVFPKPEIFLPERFINGDNMECSEFAKKAFKPFGMGRHVCLGQHLAYIVIKANIFCFVQGGYNLKYGDDVALVKNQGVPEWKISHEFPGLVVKA